ncbi:hypothetical protein MKW98_020745 [Papaver atlanticum]|uniref:Uncharacterized protein n=1 Tax=Papaver atlanticum TaxID=357466 RepID=A0AAD4XY35_9MAGN|nr:hypothetical protein MKW98_020745 [Papaver atlanticum]
MSSSINRSPPPAELRSLTENGSATYLSTNNPLLDFFFHVVPDTPHETVVERLAKAWKHDPLTSLKLICNLRGLGGTGDSDKEGFYAAALWLHEYHPKTLAANLKAMSEFGYLKDLPEILFRLHRKTLKDAWCDEKLSVPLEVRTLKAASVVGGATAISLRGYRHLIKINYGATRGKFCSGMYLSGVWEESEKRVYVNPNQRKVKEISEKSNNEDFIVVAKPDDEKTERRNAVVDAAYSYGMYAWTAEYDYDTDYYYDYYYNYIEPSDLSNYVRMRGSLNLGDFVVPKKNKNLREQLDLRKKKSRKANTPAKRAVERYANDAAYRYLHDRISDLFAELLISDLKYLNSGEVGKISLASKWCPSLDSSFDRATLLCESIARRIFLRNLNPEYENIEEAHYAYKIRNRLRKEYLVPLRKVLALPEVYVSSTNWERLLYNRVSAVAMKEYQSFFLENDKERFNKYLESVKQVKTKIAAGALLPHEILASLNHGNCDVAELQWRRMVDDMSKIGILTNCLSISDVSRSMSGTPMEVSVALGLLISEMSQQPWKGKLITFSTDPQLHEIKGDDLKSKTEFIKRMKWGMPTDFQKVFDRILKEAVDGNLKEDQMIKRLFVFSDMEFKEASYSSHRQSGKRAVWETDYQVIQKKFRAKGYMNVPEIVFWNLRESSSTPVLSQQKGVAMLSGYSKNLVKLFLEGDIGELFPVRMMEKAISGEEYNQLVVVD